MEILEDILRTVLGQNVDNNNQNLANDSTIQGHDDNNLQCEKQIIQCQITNDRLLGSTSKSLRKKYGDETVNRTIRRLAKRRVRNHCSRKAEIEKLSKTFKPIFETYFKKKSEHEFGNAL